MPIRRTDAERTANPTANSSTLRLECLPAGACYVCGRTMERSSGGKWLCKACGFLLTCCDP
jgi:hypothetical protein